MTTFKGLEDVGKIVRLMRELECSKVEILNDGVVEESNDEIKDYKLSVRFTMNDEVIVFTASAKESKLIKEDDPR